VHKTIKVSATFFSIVATIFSASSTESASSSIIPSPLTSGGSESRSELRAEVQALKSPAQNAEEVLTPLSDEDRLLNPRQILLNQPDFAADVNFFNADLRDGKAFGGYGFSERLALKGDRFREESQFWIFIGEIGKTAVRLYPQGKVYDDMGPSRGMGNSSGIEYPKSAAGDSEIIFRALGTVPIGLHKCIKIEASIEGKSTKIYYYVATDMKNLVIASLLDSPQRKVSQSLSNISFDVPDDLVQVPPDYSAILHDHWTKVDTAKVIYKGKPSNEFGVFRAPGGELFIWISDAYYRWDYLVRPEKKIVEVAFQGLLVTRSGEYIWRTKESEAFSLTGYRNADAKTIHEPAAVNGNSIRFHSFSYERDNATIEVSW
jgi:hypothetical protein